MDGGTLTGFGRTPQDCPAEEAASLMERLREGFRFILLIFLMVGLVSGCGRKPQVIKVVRPLMGTIVEISAVADNEDHAYRAIKKAFSRMEEIEREMSAFRDDSELARVNRWASRRSVVVSSDLFRVLREAVSISVLTHGAFDVTVGPLLELWPLYKKEKVLPSKNRVIQALSRVGWKYLRLSEKDHTVAFLKEGMRLDLGGIAKGYAIDQAAAVLKEEGISAGLVNAGGDVYGYGVKPDGSLWRVAIRHPRRREALAAVGLLRNGALVTSGDYERFFMEKGRRYSHILDPRTGFTARSAASVSVLAPSASMADGLATGVFVLGPREGLKVIESLPGTEAAVMEEKSGGRLEMHVSRGFFDRLKIDPDTIRSQGIMLVEAGRGAPRRERDPESR